MTFSLRLLANPSALHRGQKPQYRGKRVSETKNPHFPPRQKRAFRVKKSPFSLWRPVLKPGFFDLKRPFLAWGEVGVFRLRNPLFPDFQQFTYGVVREGVIAENFPLISAKFPQNFRKLSAEFPHPFLAQ